MALSEEYKRKLIEDSNRQEEAVRAANAVTAPVKEIIQVLPIDLLDDFPQSIHPFRPASAERLELLKDDIVQHGILSPLLVRSVNGGRYQILAGHNRKRAALLAKYTSVPCIIKDGSDDEAINIMLSDNLMQRDDLLPSEKAFAYKLKLEAMRRRQGERTDLTSVPSGQKLGMTSRELLASNSPDSNTQIQRYIRLTELSESLLKKVDDQAIGIQIGGTLSYLSPKAQEVVYTYYFVDNTSQHIDQSLANEIRAIDADPLRNVTVEELDRLAAERAERKFRLVKVQMKDIRKYFKADVTKEEVIQAIEDALAFYYENRQL